MPEVMIYEAETPTTEPVDAADFNAPVTARNTLALETGKLVCQLSSPADRPLFLLSIGFGIAFGMALACKVNISSPGTSASRRLCRPSPGTKQWQKSPVLQARILDLDPRLY